jgi:glycosyltransferase involved in cell wall biosynthesis
MSQHGPKRIVLFANTAWYLYNFRRSLAQALRDAGHDLLLLSPPGEHGERLRALGFRWEPVEMDRRSLNPMRELGLIWGLARQFRRERPDVVHGFTIKCAVYGALAARLAGVPARVSAVAGMGYVFTSNELKARLLRPLVRGLMRLSLDGAQSRLILQNPDDVEMFTRSRLMDPARIRLIEGSGVDCTRFLPPAIPRDPGQRLRVLLPARLLWDKGLAEYITAARELRLEGLALDFLLAGEPDVGNPAAVPAATVQGWVDEGLVDWLGQVEDMPALYADVDIVALPSYREGLPKGLIEAAACGRALVATDVAGCREVVTDGVDGLLVPVRDSASLAQALRRLASSADLRDRLGLAARKNALDRFDEVGVIVRTIAVYSELTGINSGS